MRRSTTDTCCLRNSFDKPNEFKPGYDDDHDNYNNYDATDSAGRSSSAASGGPNYNQMSRIIIMPEQPQYTYDVGYMQPLQPPISSAHTNYQVIPPQPPAVVPKPLIPYQKVAQQNVRPRREQPVRVPNRPHTENDYLRPINRAPRQPNLQRVMPTTEKNWKEREL